MQVNENKAEYLAKIEACDHLLKCLLARAWGGFVDNCVVFGDREDDVLVVKGAIFTIDCHGQVRVEIEVVQLGDGAAIFHIRSVATGAKDAADSHGLVGVGGGDQGTGCIVDEGGEGDGEILGILVRKSGLSTGSYSFLDGGLELRNNVLPLNTVNVEALGPALEDTMVDVVLCCRIGEGET
jgi:hypothetical protein